MKGLIALDIDGTITTTSHGLDSSIVEYFQSLHQEGWTFLFVTGRTFYWGYAVVKTLPFPFYFAVQNGAFFIEMPSCKILVKELLKAEILPTIEEICRDEDCNYIIYSGYANHDRCYWRPGRFSPSMKEYLERRILFTQDTWLAVPQFDLEEFAAVKFFAPRQSAERIALQIEKRLGLHAPPIRDPFDEKMYVVQATHPDAHKGTPVDLCRKTLGIQGPVIAAGDDLNDRPLLERADVAIVMQTAPDELLAIADYIAPPALQKGILVGLREVLKRYE